MGYIIVWRNSHKEPHIDTTAHDFKEEYSTYDLAKESAEAMMRMVNGKISFQEKMT